jgi:beta-1,4-mannooligosaccharide/beta-1,4-mannosyl-N-acetylglucosamine phosphorylase
MTQETEKKELFVRHPDNPLITVYDMPYQANAVFNAGAADLGDEVLLLMRVESCSGRSHLIVARSNDGVSNWRIPDLALIHARQNVPDEIGGAEDCRITWVKELDAWALAYVAVKPEGPGVALATTSDFETVDRIGVVLPPDNKNAALFPCTFDGDYAMLHRPHAGGGSVWIAYSPDLIHWGRHSVVIPTRGGPWWDSVRVGAGLPPIRTDEGWLVIYHGVKQGVGGPIYRLGAALLDLDRPHQIVGRARRWLLTPSKDYERTGDGPNVVFACGGFVRDETLWMYYGAADSSICLATANLSDILSKIDREAEETKEKEGP